MFYQFVSLLVGLFIAMALLVISSTYRLGHAAAYLDPWDVKADREQLTQALLATADVAQ